MQKIAATLLLISAFGFIEAQELEPRAYANLPKGLNAIAPNYGLARGNVITEPTLPIENFKITTHSLLLGYMRTFGLFGKLSRVQVILPYTYMSGSFKLNGRDTSGARSGFGDTRLRWGINLIGSPAYAMKDFRKYQQRTVIGFSIVASIPTGLYYKDKRINIGAHRWGFKPEVGISKRFKRVYAEAYTGIWFYSANKEFLTSKELKQDPVFSIQGHLCYYFKNQMWVGVNLNWFNGGITTVDDIPTGDLQDNWRVGGTWSVPLAPRHSAKLQFHVGAFTNTGYDYNVAILGYQYIF